MEEKHVNHQTSNSISYQPSPYHLPTSTLQGKTSKIKTLQDKLDTSEQQCIELIKQNRNLKDHVISMSQESIYTKAKLSNFTDLKHLRNSLRQASNIIKLQDQIKVPRILTTQREKKQASLKKQLVECKEQFQKQIKFYQAQLQAKDAEIWQLKCLFSRKQKPFGEDDTLRSEGQTTARDSICSPRSQQYKPKKANKESVLNSKRLKMSKTIKKKISKAPRKQIPSTMKIASLIAEKRRSTGSFQT